ncbi:MAG TPA: LysR family transcriptional regulator [Pseudomonadales bacterium]
MQWDSLKLFLAIAGSGSLAAAARTLDVNHSTVFRRLNAFEEELGGRVFERVATGYQLTPLGEEVLARARDIQHAMDDLERAVLGKDIQPKGVVKITAPNNIAYRFLPRYLGDFHKRYPEIRLEIFVSNLEFNMSNRQADIAVRATDAPPEHLIGRRIVDLRWSVYASEKLSKKKRPVSMQDLKDHALIGASGGMKNLKAYRAMDAKYADSVRIRCDDMVSMAHFAEAGAGLAVLPADEARKGIVRLFDFEPVVVSKLWLLTHPDLRHTERIRLVMEELAAAFQKDKDLLSP